MNTQSSLLHAVEAPADSKSSPRSPARARRPIPQADDLGVVSQVKRAFSPRHRLASVIGLLVGGFVPIAVYQVSHGELAPLTRAPASWVPWAITGAGLVYSAHTVYTWAQMALGKPLKAVGYVVLLEGTMVGSRSPWLSFVALGYLVAINAMGTACRLSLGRSADLARELA